MLSRRFLRIKVVKALYAHLKSESVSLSASEKSLIYSLDKAYDLYFQLLQLVVDVQLYAAERIEIARNKLRPTQDELHPNMRLVENRVVEQIAGSKRLAKQMTDRGLGWASNPELVKNLYKNLIESDYYAAYMNAPTNNYRDDKQFVIDFYINTVQDNETLSDVLEEQSIVWSDDVDFGLIMVVRTLESMSAKQNELPILPQYKNDDDLNFAKELFRYSVVNYKESLDYIERFTRNWDVERIAFMDNLIMVTAMSELVLFDSIPVKVTLDEYIEIAKYYSTMSSSLFINGILDKVVESLRNDGRINKRGRGLL